MVRAWIAAIITGSVITVSAWAGVVKPVRPSGPDFLKRKDRLLMDIDRKIAQLQEERKCFQESQNHTDLDICSERQRAAREQRRGN